MLYDDLMNTQPQMTQEQQEFLNNKLKESLDLIESIKNKIKDGKEEVNKVKQLTMTSSPFLKG